MQTLWNSVSVVVHLWYSHVIILVSLQKRFFMRNTHETAYITGVIQLKWTHLHFDCLQKLQGFSCELTAVDAMSLWGENNTFPFSQTPFSAHLNSKCWKFAQTTPPPPPRGLSVLTLNGRGNSIQLQHEAPHHSCMCTYSSCVWRNACSNVCHFTTIIAAVPRWAEGPSTRAFRNPDHPDPGRGQAPYFRRHRCDNSLSKHLHLLCLNPPRPLRAWLLNKLLFASQQQRTRLKPSAAAAACWKDARFLHRCQRREADRQSARSSPRSP